MISELVVTDLSVFAHARLELGPGLNALTGETGAGKSLVIGAIELLLGARADASIVRPGAEQATVDGRFLDRDGQEVVLSRVVPRDGRSRAYVNGRPVTAGELADIGAGLVELHGQHAHQRLLRTDSQRQALDRFGRIDLGPLRAARAEVRDLDAALDALGGDDRTRAREIDLLRYQLDELDSAELRGPDEDAELDAEEDVLADAVTHNERGAAATDALAGDEGAADALQTAIGLIAGRAPFVELESRLRGAAADLDDAAHELRSVTEAIVEDPERLSAIRQRRQLLADLRRKYGDTLTEVISERDRIRTRLDELESHDVRAAELTAARDAAQAAADDAAAVVADARRAAAPRLADGVQARLRRLAMPHADVVVEVAGAPPCDQVAFLLAANPGSDPKPMAKVASGGELSRTTLAVRLELSAGPPSLVFDEIDAGIGGETAIAVASALSDLADRHQILVVTHLPQVAAFADRQLQVSKSAGADSTDAGVTVLDGNGRVGELARMLDGRPESDLGRQHAVELLAAASDQRRSA